MKVLLPLIALPVLWLATACVEDEAPQRGASNNAREYEDANDADLGRQEARDEREEGEEGNDDESGTGSSQERISFTGSRGDKVPGYLWLPKKRNGKVPAVLVMYGIQGDKDDDSVRLVGEFLNRKGFAALTLDWPGTGERGSDISTQDRILNTDVMLWTVGDYGAALKYLTGRDEIDDERIGYAGASMGAMTGLVFAARERRIKAVVAIVPIPNPLWGNNDPTTRIGEVSPRPVLCIYTQANVDMSSVVCNGAGKNGVKQAVAADHELSGFREQVAEDAADFFVKHLK